jgi:hypothetical protein
MQTPRPSTSERLHRFARAVTDDLELARTPAAQQRARVARRILVAVLLLVTLDLGLRMRRDTLDATFFHHYRMPNVSVPPLREYAAAVARRRERDPGTLVVGAAGPSFIWGHGYPSEASIPARLAQKLDAAGGGFTSLNLAMLRNRYADDRMVAEFFGGLADVVLVPYSAYEAEGLALGYCPSHLDIVEWTGRFPGPFPLAAQCHDRDRHALNAWLEDTVSRGWFAYGHRAGLRQLVFPEAGDFGASLLSAANHAVRQEPARALPPGIDNAPPQLVARGASVPSTDPDPPGLLREIDLLCRAYASRGTTVLFYYLPTVEEPSLLARDRSLVDAFDRALTGVTRAEPRCRRLDLRFDALLSADDYFDRVHPSARGFEKIATELATALIDLRAAGKIQRNAARP